MAFRNWKQELEDKRPDREIPWPFIFKTAAGAVMMVVMACGALWVWPGYLLAKPWKRPGPAPERIVIIFSSDVSGHLEPCGCTDQRWGGLPRSGGYLGGIKQPVTRFIFDAGSMTAGGRKWQRMAWETFLESAEALDYTAVNLGAGELTVSADDIKRIAAASSVPIISANVLDAETDRPLVKPYVEMMVDNLRLTVVGVVQSDDVTVSEALEVADVDQSLGALLPELRRRTDVLVVLAACDEERIGDIARRHPEVDVIIGGRVRQASREIENIGACRILYHANSGQLLGRMDLAIRPDGRPADATSAMILLDNAVPEDADMVKLVERYNGELASLARTDGLGALGVQLSAKPAGGNAYVGSETCRSCHPQSYATWRSYHHSRALESLVKAKRQSNPDCIRCHVVNLGAADGYRGASVSPERANVQCESCHGRAGLHVRARIKKRDKTIGKLAKVGRQSCEVCHDALHSPKFNYTGYWKRIVHGKEKGGKKAVEPAPGVRSRPAESKNGME